MFCAELFNLTFEVEQAVKNAMCKTGTIIAPQGCQLNIKILIVRQLFCPNDIFARIRFKEDKTALFAYAGIFPIVKSQEIFLFRILFNQRSSFFEPLLPPEFIEALSFQLFLKNTLFNASGFIFRKQRHQMLNVVIAAILKARFEPGKNLPELLFGQMFCPVNGTAVVATGI
ncbi:hypothetical protein BACCAP_02260 [Pseudoflavonifractor capillosus ATCC 29799]|uniref:Uncharacterized protein n=1 Tax=Pseudoflavonifractor capillosus ATCC 29799 TaxID=411467 RepID=A6NVL7_9FIRM|nr:hypothetical protein BACCAP_02260 [Pseudoflavonifractor capillosus ATCC 29799]